MIEIPARLAGFRFEKGLVNRLLTDAQEKDNRHGVPLLEFALAKLYQPFAEQLRNGESIAANKRCFTANDHAAFGGFKGAIGTATKEAVAAVADSTRVLPGLFGALVTLSAKGKPTRRRAPRSELARDSTSAELTEQLIGDQDHARLLVADGEHVEVAHQILFDAWQDMAEWITEFEYDLQQRDLMSYEARQWDAGGRKDDHLLWSDERQRPLYAALERLGRPIGSLTNEPERSA